MITRPLELVSRLRPDPRNFDWLFFVNGGFIVFFFFLFGSRFVLAPGLGVNFQLPIMAGSTAAAAPTTHRISVVRADLIFVDEGAINAVDLRGWLVREAKKVQRPSLLVLVGSTVPTTVFTAIASSAHAAGFVHVQMATQESTAQSGGAR